MRKYLYEGYDVGSKEYHIASSINLYADNMLIESQIDSVFNLSRHDYDYTYSSKDIIIDNVVYTTFPKTQNNGDDDELAYFDNALFIVTDLNSKINGNPIYVHLD